MAVTDILSQTSKKSKHKNDSSISRNNSSHDRSHISPDDSETDLDRPLFKQPSQSKRFSKKIPVSHSASGDASDSETDIDKPVKRSVSAKSVSRTDHVANGRHSQTVQNHKVDNENDDDSEGVEEQLSMSLLQPYEARIPSKMKSSQLKFRNSQSNGSHAGNDNNLKVQRRSNVQEMSSSEYESSSEEEAQPKSAIHNKSEARPHLHTQQEPESESEEESEYEEEPSQPLHTKPQKKSKSEEESEESEEEDEEKERQSHDLNNLVKVKKEVLTPETSDTENDNLPDDRGEALLHPEEFLETHQAADKSVPSTVQQSLSVFEMDHSPISAPIVDIPQDSRVWVMQVPRSIPANQLQGQCFPLNAEGSSIWNLPSGRWQILKQENSAPENAMSCIVSTGNLSYAVRWLQPEAFLFLKRVPAAIHMESQELVLRKETTPLPIKDLLKMKSKKASKRKSIHSVKRVQNISHVHPSKILNSEILEDDSSSLHSPKKKKKKKHENSSANEESMIMDPNSSRAFSKHKKHEYHSAMDTTQENMLHVIQGSSAEKQRKRKRSMESDGGSPEKKKKKKKKQDDEATDLDNLYSEPADTNIDAAMTTRDSSMSKMNKEKKKKHKEKNIELNQIKQEYTAKVNSDEKREHTNIPSQQDNGRKHKRRKNLEEAAAIEETFSDTEHSDMAQNTKKEKDKKKKMKHRNKESELEKSLKSFEDDPTTPREEDNGDNFSVVKKKKKKHKHKDIEDSDHSKVKQEEESFWERETSPEFLSRLYLTQIAPDD